MNYLTKKRLSRRFFLKGAGYAIALPFLEAMIPAMASAQQSAAPKRVGYLYFPHGTHSSKWSWTPSGSGTGFTFPTGLASTNLVNYKPDLIVLGGLLNNWGIYNIYGDVSNDHNAAVASYLTGARANQSLDNVFFTLSTASRGNALPIAMGHKSVDVLIAQTIGPNQKIPVLHITPPGNARTLSDVPYSNVYRSNLSWISPTQPTVRYNSPSKVFAALFGAGGASPTPTPAPNLQSQRKSILDAALEEANRLSATLGTTDKAKLDEYLTSVREVERSISLATPPSGGGGMSCNSGSPPADNVGLDAMTKSYLDMIVLAFQCDQTRVVSYMMDYELNGTSYGFAGATKYDGHAASHGNFSEDYSDAYKIVNWYANQFAYLIGKMKNVTESNGTLLSNSIMHLGSGTNTTGGDHPDDNLPMVIAGQGGGLMSTGRSILANGARLSNYHLALLRKLGINVNSFGDSNGMVAGL